MLLSPAGFEDPRGPSIPRTSPSVDPQTCTSQTTTKSLRSSPPFLPILSPLSDSSFWQGDSPSLSPLDQPEPTLA
ncbi:hypothetical protein SRHO_G00055120 [Serrasalmus rhombeus]